MVKPRELTLLKVFENIGQISRIMATSRDKFLSGLGLSRAQFEVFLLLKHGELSTKDIAGKLNITSGAATQIVDSLEKAGLVERFSNASDRRVVFVRHTVAGAEKFGLLRKNYLNRLSNILLPVDDKDLEVLARSTSHILDKLSDESIKQEQKK